MSTASEFQRRFLELCQLVERQERQGRLSQAELAAVFKRAGVREATQPNISRWLNGTRRPRYLETYEALARVAGVSVGWLTFGEGVGETPAPIEPKERAPTAPLAPAETRAERARQKSKRRRGA